jgi:hypothetical protein
MLEVTLVIFLGEAAGPSIFAAGDGMRADPVPSNKSIRM